MALLNKLYLAEQVDLLHTSLINLLDICRDGEIDLVLEQQAKSTQQKALFIKKIIDELPSPELRAELEPYLAKKDFEFFGQISLSGFLRGIQKQAESTAVIRLKVAIDFKERDLREMSVYMFKKVGKPVVFDLTVDKTLIGGAIVQYGNYISDYSLQTQLQQFKDHWHTAVVEG
jgi:F0F1-type ATP synthase delta subunit